MRFNKLFSTKSITNLLYGFLLLMPFCAVLGRLIYTQANLNAKDSYYGDTINEFKYTNINVSNMHVGNTYHLIAPSTLSYTPQTSNTELSVNNVLLNDVVKNVSTIRFYAIQSNTLLYIQGIGNDGFTIVSTDRFDLSFSYLGINNNYYSDEISTILYQITYNKYSYLDNAFEYSLYTFTDDNNLGGVDFFGWFTNLFLNQSNSHNAVYLNFANWYMNYALLVSSGYLIFMALIWFINYVRRIMDKSMNHDFGGF